MVPLEILVGMESAWKKEVFSGPKPVFCGWIKTSQGAIAPALAGAFTLFSRILSLTSTNSKFVNTNPTFALMWGKSLSQNPIKINGNNQLMAHFSRWGLFSRCPLMAFLIIVFLPIRSTASFLRDCLICCICLDPTLSTPTIKHFGYSSKSCCKTSH